MATATNTLPTTRNRTELIESKIDREVAGKLSINLRAGGASFENMAEVMEFAKLMAISHQAVPPHCRDNPGVCLGVTIQAVEWRMSPFAVANKSYIVNDRLSYESQLIHAVIEQRAPIKGRLRHSYSGEGAKRKCRVWAIDRESGEDLSYESPEFAAITPKNSPLWKSKPDLQLYYNTSRDWARVYYPDVILGVYSNDELIDSMPGSQAIPKMAGVEGLKRRLLQDESRSELAGDTEVMGATDETDQPADEAGEGVDSLPADDFTDDPQSMTDEERRDMEAGGNGKLFDNSPEYK